MRHAAIALHAACLQLFGAPAPKEKEKPVLYYSTKVGDTLVYEVTISDGKPSEQTVTVTEAEEKDGVFRFSKSDPA